MTGWTISAAKRMTKRHTRLCLLAGSLLGASFAAPGLAHAADPFGGGLDDIQAALTEAQTTVDQATAATGATVAPRVDTSQAFAAATSGVAAAAEEAETAAATPVTAVSVASADVEARVPAASTRGEDRAAANGSGRPGRPHPAGPAAARETAPAAAAPPPRAADFGRAAVVRPTHRAAGARAERKAPAGAQPQRLPPDRSPPRPDPTSSASGAGGGQNPPVPLLLVALAAVFGLFRSRFLPRVLPQLAFRKPRHLGLPSWHPG